MGGAAFSCKCGKLRGAVTDASAATGTHAECFCTSCRAGAIYAGAADPAPGPVAIFQTAPHRLNIEAGQEQLACFAFGPKNLRRWYATCCGTPLFNTPRNMKLAFVGINADLFEETAVLGPVRARGFIPTPQGKPRHEGLSTMIGGFLKRTGAQWLSGKWRNNPLFDVKTGDPIRPVTVLSREERRALVPDA